MKIWIRRSHIVLASVLALWVAGCANDPSFSTRPTDTIPDPLAGLARDTFNCPLPVGFINGGNRIPSGWHGYQQLSPDRRRLAYLANGLVRVLDLQSGSDQVVRFWSRLPANVRLVTTGGLVWCPYDNNRLLLFTVTETDTNNDGRRDVGGTNAYIASLDGTELTRVTPGMFGPYSSNYAFGFTAWLAGSTPSLDSIHMGGRGIYIPQRDTFVPSTSRSFYNQTRDGSRSLGIWLEPYNDTLRLAINGQPLRLPMGTTLIDWASWSPDGKLLALSAAPPANDDSVAAGDYSRIWRQIWIVDVDRYLREGLAVAPMEVINMQERFCTYSLHGIFAEFITDRTLAVSMYKDGDPVSVLWEITTDGRKVRQLTMIP